HLQAPLLVEESDASDELELGTDRPDESTGSRYSQLLQVAVILIVIGVYFGAWRHPQPSASTELPATNVATAPAPAEKPVATTGTIDTQPLPSDPQSDLKVDIRPQGECWVQATADGAPVMARLMMAGEKQTID